jgi:hypothetical protein
MSRPLETIFSCLATRYLQKVKKKTRMMLGAEFKVTSKMQLDLNNANLTILLLKDDFFNLLTFFLLNNQFKREFISFLTFAIKTVNRSINNCPSREMKWSGQNVI